MELPDALKYSASHSTIRTNRFRLTPQGSDSVLPNGTVRVRLPEKSLVRLSSLSAYFNATVSGLVHDAANWKNALIPASYKFFRAVRFYVGGQIASGGLCNHYDQLYHALVVSSADIAWCQSRFNEGYRELITGDEDDAVLGQPLLNASPGAGVTSKTQYLTCSDFLGLPRCNGGGGVIDTSLFNSVEIEFVFNDDSILSVATAGNATVDSITWSLANFRVDVDCVVSVSPLYVEMMALRLAEATPIKFPYQNMVTTISKDTGSNRIQVNTQSLDIMMVAPLKLQYNVKLAKGASQTQPNRYKFDTKIGPEGGAVADQNTYVTNASSGKSLSLTVGSDQYPKLPIQNLLDVPDLTINTFYHGSLNSKNLLSQGMSAGNTQFHRSYGLSDNFVWANNFSLESEGWASRRLTGIDTSAQNVDIIVNSSGFGTATEAVGNANTAGIYWFMCALITSTLTYDPSTATVSIIQ